MVCSVFNSIGVRSVGQIIFDKKKKKKKKKKEVIACLYR